MNSVLLDHALELAAHGYAVFPCAVRDKVPAISIKEGGHGCLDATFDQSQIRKWWGQNPNYNIGVACGKISGIWVLDVDGQPGIESMMQLIKQGQLPKTVWAKSGSGGTHYLWRYPGWRVGNSKRKMPGLDTRGDGGYIVAAPSIHPSGGVYAWGAGAAPWEHTLMAAPDWLMRIFTPDPEITRREPTNIEGLDTSPEMLDSVSEELMRRAVKNSVDNQERHPSAVWLACQLLDHRIPVEAARATMLRYREYVKKVPWNPQRIMPESEVLEVLSHVYGHLEPRKPFLLPRASVVDTEEQPAHANNSKGTASVQAAAPRQEKVTIPSTSKPKMPIPYIQFPMNLLPEAVRLWVDKCAQAIPCDPAMIALPALAMFAGAIGATRVIRLKRSWPEPSVLWCTIVAPSGTNKSPALDGALKPIQKIERRAWHEFKQAHTVWTEEMKAYKATQKKEPRSSPPSAPKPQRVIVGDATVEALAPLLLDNPRGLLLFREELSGWLGSMGQYKSGGRGDDLQKWIEMHGARALRVDRKSPDSPPIYVPRAAVSVVGSIQPGILQRAIGEKERDSGFLARLLMAAPPETAKVWTDDDDDEKSDSRVQAIVEKLLSLDFDKDRDGEDVPVELWPAPHALEPFQAYVNETGAAIVGIENGPLRAAMSKHEGCAARLALILHLVELADLGEPINAPVTVQAIERGIGLAKWFTQETARIYEILSENDQTREIHQVLDAVNRLGGRATPRDLVETMRKFRGDGGMERAETILRSMARGGLGDWVERQHTGAGRPVYELVLKEACRCHNSCSIEENQNCDSVTAPYRDENGESIRDIDILCNISKLSK